MSTVELAFYNEAARICGKIMKELGEKIDSKKFPLDIKLLTEYGNNRILEETSCIYKKIKDKGIASPVSVSLNNFIGNTIDTQTTIREGDIVKVEFSVSVSGYIATICETFLTHRDDEFEKILEYLNTVPATLKECMIRGETNDEVKITIESQCTDNKVFPIENCISYQQQRYHCQTFDSKYIVFNHQKKYDNNDLLQSIENLCFDFETDEVYTINLTVIPSRFESVKYITHQNTYIYRFNDLQYQLKLKNSRAFLNQVKADKSNYKFDIREYNSSPKHRMGIRECCDNGILDSFPVVSVNSLDEIVPVFTKKFTVITKNDSCYILKY